jgi:hypothetical protein
MARSTRALRDCCALLLGAVVGFTALRALPTVHAASSFPGISMTLPANGDTLTGVVLLTALADGGGLAGLQFQVNGTALGAEITAGSCSAEWNTANTPDGTYVLNALVRDELGNLMPTSPVFVSVTNAAPEISAVTALNVGNTTATVTWLTGQTATSVVEYGLTASYGTYASVDTLVSNHAVPLSGLAPLTMYHYRVRSVNWRGILSTSGDFILWTGSAPAPDPGGGGGCATPDPFAPLGGGTCWNGGWLPPGILPPDPTPPPGPVLGPEPVNSICGGLDPFAGMGGGVCWAGGWLPPGMAAPAASPTAPFVLGPPTPATPVLGPPVGNATCATPDPFTVLGGGICSNGGWLPPGSQVPTAGSGGGGSSSPTGRGGLGPSPASGGNQFCLGPDPFSSLPGYRGLCVSGGWIPRPIGGN